MSGLQKTAIAGGAIFAGKVLFDFSKEAVNAAVAADEAAASFWNYFRICSRKSYTILRGFC